MSKKTLSLGVLYAHDSWDQYWEGTLKRTNGNIGTLTTESVTMVAGYSVSDRLGLIAALPYVWTHASQGVLHDMSGVQDLALGAFIGHRVRHLSDSLSEPFRADAHVSFISLHWGRGGDSHE